MAEPTLIQLFGTLATQTATDLVIKKSDLVAVGLTASANNTAESLLVAILKLAASYSNPTTQETNTDIQVTLEINSTPSIVTRNNLIWRQTSISVELQTLDTTAEIDPDNY
jgi:hypothetical protein